MPISFNNLARFLHAPDNRLRLVEPASQAKGLLGLLRRLLSFFMGKREFKMALPVVLNKLLDMQRDNPEALRTNSQLRVALGPDQFLLIEQEIGQNENTVEVTVIENGEIACIEQWSTPSSDSADAPLAQMFFELGCDLLRQRDEYLDYEEFDDYSNPGGLTKINRIRLYVRTGLRLQGVSDEEYEYNSPDIEENNDIDQQDELVRVQQLSEQTLQADSHSRMTQLSHQQDLTQIFESEPPDPTTCKNIRALINSRLEELKHPSGLTSGEKNFSLTEDGLDFISSEQFDQDSDMEWCLLRSGSKNYRFITVETAEHLIKKHPQDPLTREPLDASSFVRGKDILAMLK